MRHRCARNAEQLEGRFFSEGKQCSSGVARAGEAFLCEKEHAS
jgi:hypothetical protein